MINILRTLAIFLVTGSILSSCSKSSSSSNSVTSQSVVGKWSLANVSGNIIYKATDSSGFTTLYSYKASTMTEINESYGSTNDTTTTLFTKELWTFNSDGTYTISEIFTQTQFGAYGGTNPPDTASATGNWEYLNSASSNNAIVFMGGLSTGLPFSSSYNIKSVNGSQLVLVYNGSQSMSGIAVNVNFTITFVKVN